MYRCGTDAMSSFDRVCEWRLAADGKRDRFRMENVASAGGLAAELQEKYCDGMDRCYGTLIMENALWKEALSLAFHDDMRLASRASWALEWAYFHNRDAFAPYCVTFFEDFLRVTNPSVHRHYGKILYDMLRCGLFVPDDFQAAQIAERAFDLLTGGKIKSAVRIWAAEILYELSPRIDWVRENLEDIIRHQIETMPTPAILNHYGKLLKRMAGKK